MKQGGLDRYRHAVGFIDGLANLPRSDDYMSGRSRPAIFLERTKAFLKLLGNPERGFKYVHITGTAGKGSVSAMVYESLMLSGKRVGAFTSPFVVAATEKIRASTPGGDDLFISPDEFADIVEELKPYIEKMQREHPHGRPSYFELYLAIAFMYFKRKKCEWVVLEVGAGGRYDATNVIKKPIVTAITSIDYDHTRLLGRTLKSIAGNKVGIAKKGSVLFTTERRPVILEQFAVECRKVGSEFHALPVSTDYRVNNATLARAIGKRIGLSDDAIEKGIMEAKLPCRFELVQENQRIVLDGAHNRAKVRSTIANLKEMPHRKLHLVLGFKGGKDSRTMTREIAPYADHLYATRFQLPGLTCTDPHQILEVAASVLKKGAKATVYLDSHDALQAARSAAAPGDLILVTGSFYLAGELRKEWYSEEWVLTNRKSFK